MAERGKDDAGVAAYRRGGTVNMVRLLNGVNSFPSRYWRTGPSRRHRAAHHRDHARALPRQERGLPTLHHAVCQAQPGTRRTPRGARDRRPRVRDDLRLRRPLPDRRLRRDHVPERHLRPPGRRHHDRRQPLRPGDRGLAARSDRPRSSTSATPRAWPPFSNRCAGATRSSATSSQRASSRSRRSSASKASRCTSRAWSRPATTRARSRAWVWPSSRHRAAPVTCAPRSTRPSSPASATRRSSRARPSMYIDWEDRLCIMDTLIYCRFYRDMVPWPYITAVVNAAIGTDFSTDDLHGVGGSHHHRDAPLQRAARLHRARPRRSCRGWITDAPSCPYPPLPDRRCVPIACVVFAREQRLECEGRTAIHRCL